MIVEAKGCALSCIFSGQVNWRAGSCNRKKPWRHLSLPDEENSNYSGKSISNPIFLPYRPRGSLEVEKVTGKCISQILLVDLYLLRALKRAPLFWSTFWLSINTEAGHIGPALYMKIFFFFLEAHSFSLLSCLYWLSFSLAIPFTVWLKNRKGSCENGHCYCHYPLKWSHTFDMNCSPSSGYFVLNELEDAVLKVLLLPLRVYSAWLCVCSCVHKHVHLVSYLFTNIPTVLSVFIFLLWKAHCSRILCMSLTDQDLWLCLSH